MRHPVRFGALLGVCVGAACLASAQTDADWLNPAGGDWFTPGNWSGDRVPDNAGGETFHARIALPAPAPYTVGLTGSATIDNLTLSAANATLRASAGTFRVRGTANLAGGTFLLGGATLSGGSWNATGAVARVTELSTLEGITWNGTLSVSNGGTVLRIRNGLTLNGQWSLTAPNTSLVFDGVQTLTGGTVLLDPSSATASMNVQAGAALTLSSATIIRGGAASLTGAGTLTNYGLVRAERTGQTTSITPTTFANHGAIECAPGARLTIGATNTNWVNNAGATIETTSGILTLSGNWTNAGTIRANASTVNLGGTFATASLAGFERTAGVVNLTGTMNNMDATYTIDAANGPWTVAGGTIIGGMLSASDQTPLNISGAATARLIDVNFSGAVSLQADSRLWIDATSTHPARVTFVGGGARFGVSGQRVLNGTELNLTGSANAISVEDAGFLTLGPDQRVEGAVVITDQRFTSGGPGAVRNEGLIRGGAGQSVQITPNYFANAGVCESVGGSMLIGDITTPIDSWDNLPGGLIRVTNGTLDLNGSWSNRGTIEATNSTVHLRGAFSTADLAGFSRQGGVVNLWNCVLDNADAQISLDQQTGSWNLIGATIQGGVMSLTPDATLTFDHNSASTPVTTLRDLTIHGDLNLRNSSARVTTLYMGRDATLDGTITLGAFGRLRLQPGRTWSTPITFAAGATLSANEPGEITFAPGTLITGGFGGTMSFTQGATAVNRGVIRSNRRMESVTLDGDLINEGVIEAVNEGRLNVLATSPALWRNAAGGLVTVGPGSMLSTNGEWQNHGLITVADGEAIFDSPAPFRPATPARSTRPTPESPSPAGFETTEFFDSRIARRHSPDHRSPAIWSASSGRAGRSSSRVRSTTKDKRLYRMRRPVPGC